MYLTSVAPARAGAVEPVPVASAVAAAASAAVPDADAQAIAAPPASDAGAPTIFPDSASAANADVEVELNCEGRSVLVATKPETVGTFLLEQRIHVAEDDFVSAPLDAQVTDGMLLSYRKSKTITLLVGRSRTVVHSAAATIDGVLREQRVALGPNDRVDPPLAETPLNSDVIRVTRAVAVAERHRARVALASLPHERPKAHRAARHPRTLLASRIIRVPRARIAERGIAAYASLAAAAQTGFSSAMHFAGAALHMIATAYTASCYGCSGRTATGARAGFGIIAVDPSVIPLGTHLFIPGYGRAVAGDTGGAIVGHRVDLGMNTVTAALHFGRRPVTVYVLR
jgi:3D (Asp-Asp-Asp) domain-containing protein